MNPNQPPKDGLYMQCDYLEVTGQQHGQKTTQMMRAEGPNVRFKTDQYDGTANIITYNEHTDVITLEATNGNTVMLYKSGQRQAVNATKVLYNRKTGTVDSVEVKSITN